MAKKNLKSKDELNPENNWIKDKLDSLAPDSIPTVKTARAQLDARINHQKKTAWQKLFGGKLRAAWVTAAVLAVLAITFSFPQVQAIANSFLGLFRVEKIEAVDVGIRLDNLPNELGSRFTALDNIIADQLIIDHEGQTIPVQDIGEAAQLAGFKARMPAQLQGETVILYQDSSSVRLVIDRDQWQALLDSMGYDEFVLPESSDGEEIKLNLPKAVIIGVGDCQYNDINEVKLAHPETQNCTVLMQSQTPTVEAPAGIDINQAGQVILQTLGMSKADAEAFSATVNWATTLVVPVPSDVEYRDIMVEGVNGIFLEDRYDGGKAVYTLLWIKDGLFHALIGDGTLTEALQIVRSLE